MYGEIYLPTYLTIIHILSPILNTRITFGILRKENDLYRVADIKKITVKTS